MLLLFLRQERKSSLYRCWYCCWYCCWCCCYYCCCCCCCCCCYCCCCFQPTSQWAAWCWSWPSASPSTYSSSGSWRAPSAPPKEGEFRSYPHPTCLTKPLSCVTLNLKFSFHITPFLLPNLDLGCKQLMWELC